jgi:hypothetical protein
MDNSDDICYTEFYVGTIIADATALWNIYRSDGATTVNPIIVLSNGVALKGQSLAAGTWQQYRLDGGGRYYSLARGTAGGQQQWRRQLVCGDFCSSNTPETVDESSVSTTTVDGSGLIELSAASSFTGWTITATVGSGGGGGGSGGG